MTYPRDCEQKLGFDQVRQRLSNYCLSTLGAKEVEEIRFISDHGTLETLLRQNLEFHQLLQQPQALPTSNFFDPEPCWRVIAVEDSFLEEETFQHFVLSLQVIFAYKEYFTANRERYPSLYMLCVPVALSGKVLPTIQSRFDDNGHVKDNASEELARVRKKIKEEQHRARKLVDQIFRMAADQGYVPEGMSPTVRDGRVVIPLLSEHKRKIRGFISDESATGQTVFIEPAEVLEANNEIRDLLLAERREVVKILKTLTAHLRENLSDLRSAYNFLAKVDFNRAKARLAADLDAHMPRLTEAPALNWIEARHPLLFLNLRGKRPVVPLNIDLTEADRFLLISGPNAGGKSVCLKTVGLIQYMLQCGLLVPVDERSTAGIFGELFIDIGDQQSIENDLSTYSSHLNNMRHFLQLASGNSLVLLDELGTGTDPNFGGGIAQAVLDGLVKRRVWGVATTHYYNLKLYAERTAGIRNGAMLFDTKKLGPLFILEIGKPGSSFALEIARKTGLPPGIIQEAEKIIGKDLTGLETLLKSVTDEKQRLQVQGTELKKREKELQEALTRYTQLSAQLEERRKEILNQAKIEASQLLKETNREIEKTIRHIQENKAEKKETRKVRKGLSVLEEKVKLTTKPAKNAEAGKIEIGDKVRIIGQEVTGTVLSIKDKKAVVQFGDVRSTVNTGSLIRSSEAEPVSAAKRIRDTGVNLHTRQSSFNSTLDVRGKRVDEVIPVLTRFLDDAILLGQGELRILHGKGEGVLRKVIRDELKRTRGVASFGDEHVDRGGDGITVVVLK